MTGKIRAKLRSMANTMEPILFIGVNGITPSTIKEGYDALEKRELIKCAVQENCELNAREACNQICEKLHAEPIQCIGKKFVIYRESSKNKQIDLEDL